MKKILLILLTSTMLAGSGCSKASDPTPTAPAPQPAPPDYSQLILGKWVSSSSVAETTTGSQVTTKTTNYDYGGVSEVFTAKNVTAYLKASAVGSNSYMVTGNSYTVQDAGSSRTFDIVSISASPFVRRFTSTSGTSTTVTTTTLLR
jgi:hypothetical protein